MKYVLEFDTITKEAMLTLDGEKVENLNQLTLYSHYTSRSDEKKLFSIEVRQCMWDEANKMSMQHVTYAADSESEDPEVYRYSQSDLEKQAAKLLKGK